MNIKHPRFKILNSNPNPRLAQLFEASQELINTQYENDTHVNFLFYLCEIIEFQYKNITDMALKLTPESFNLYVMFQAMGCFQSGGLAVGIYGNAPHLAPFIPDAAKQVGFPEIAEAIQHTNKVFPEATNFLENDDLYCAILNFMENPRRKPSDARLQHLTTDDLKQYHNDYNAALESIEPLMEQYWFNTDYPKLKVYYEMHKNKQFYK